MPELKVPTNKQEYIELLNLALELCDELKENIDRIYKECESDLNPISI